jgi:hypothetical protein
VGAIFDALATYLGRADWPLERDEPAGRLSFPMVGDNGSWYVDAFAREEASQALMVATFPLEIPQERIADAALLVARMNDELVIGSFDLNVDTGEVRFRVAIDTGGEPLTDPLIEPLFLATLAQMDANLPRLGELA